MFTEIETIYRTAKLKAAAWRMANDPASEAECAHRVYFSEDWDTLDGLESGDIFHAIHAAQVEGAGFISYEDIVTMGLGDTITPWRWKVFMDGDQEEIGDAEVFGVFGESFEPRLVSFIDIRVDTPSRDRLTRAEWKLNRWTPNTTAGRAPEDPADLGPDDVYVGRAWKGHAASKYGNPNTPQAMPDILDQQNAYWSFLLKLTNEYGHDLIIEPLRGKRLLCPCHGRYTARGHVVCHAEWLAQTIDTGAPHVLPARRVDQGLPGHLRKEGR